jgi:hypothetical protein
VVRQRNPENAAAVSSFGKSLEAWVRKLRPHLRPSYRNAYAALLARKLGERKPGEPIVCCDFADGAIDAVGGRYYFSLVLDLIDAGYFPVFTARRLTVSTFGTSRVKSLLLDKRLGMVRSADDLSEPFLLITDTDATPPEATKIVRVAYGHRLPVRPGEIPFPVFVHPRIAIGGNLPFSYDLVAKRPVRLFFGGNTEEGKYDKNVIGEVYRMLTRREMIAAVVDQAGENRIHRPVAADRWLTSDEPADFVLCETQKCKIPGERWLDAMAKADFFLACPGVGMPLCHNLIESLAAGAVPVLQYSAYLTPELEDGVNCLAFHDEASLRKVVDRVLSMDEQEILSLRRGAKTYYDTYLAPGRFADRLLNDPHSDTTLLMNSYRVPRG